MIAAFRPESGEITPRELALHATGRTRLSRSAAMGCPPTRMEETSRVRPEPDVILPRYLLGRTIATPEKRLLLAVLEEAAETYRRYVFTTDRRHHAIFVDVQAWFASEDTAWLYSFVGICDALGLEATYVRSGLRPWAERRRTPSHETGQPHHLSFRRVNGLRHRTTGRPAGVGRA